MKQGQMETKIAKIELFLQFFLQTLPYLSRVPSLAGELSGLGIVHRRVEDGDAEVAILVDVWVPDFREES